MFFFQSSNYLNSTSSYFTSLVDNPSLFTILIEDFVTNHLVNVDNLFVYNFKSDCYFLFIFSIVSFVLSFSLFFVSYLLGTSVVILDVEKRSAYECGFSPVEDSRKTVDLKFYKTAILFLVFDIEVLFLIPWCVALLTNSSSHLIYMKTSAPFLFILLIGIVLEYKENLFKW